MFVLAKLKLEQSLTSIPPQEDDSSYEIASPRDGTNTARVIYKFFSVFEYFIFQSNATAIMYFYKL